MNDFKDWLAGQVGRDDPVGSLALRVDLEGLDWDWDELELLDRLTGHLRRRGWWDEEIAGLHQAWTEWGGGTLIVRDSARGESGALSGTSARIRGFARNVTS